MSELGPNKNKKIIEKDAYELITIKKEKIEICLVD